LFLSKPELPKADYRLASKKPGGDATPPRPRPELLKSRLWDDKPRELAELASVRELPDGTEANLVGLVPQGN
jgi:hypothetical protein